MINKLTSNIHPSSFLGVNVNIDNEAAVGPNSYLDGEISIGKNSKLVGGVTIIGKLRVGENCVLEPGVCIANGNNYAMNAAMTPQTTIASNVYVGAGSILVAGISIGNNAIISAGTNISRNIPANAFVQGNPAVITGYSKGNLKGVRELPCETSCFSDEPGVYKCSVPGVTIHRFQRIRDLRGDLTVGEFPKDIPFKPKRYFLVYDVPSAETRGEHAHRECQQFLICVAGSLAVVVDNGITREEFLLDHPNIGLYIPPGIWGIQYKYSGDGVLLVFASEHYAPKDYIRNYDAFLKEKGVS